jgi:hypothetical protein
MSLIVNWMVRLKTMQNTGRMFLKTFQMKSLNMA